MVAALTIWMGRRSLYWRSLNAFAVGTTSLTPTTLSCSDEELLTVLRCYETVKAEWTDRPNLLGMHLKGVFCPHTGGRARPEIPSPAGRCTCAVPLDASGNIVRMSAAAELPGALALGDELKKRGILASIGHSDALTQTQ